ncbi:hypothetical protein LSH36_501g01130 [Paralvinella palmiformis]|uniref:RNA polymerase II subunit A C-terminal domain phosphatase SSU72 n=1 Tax=Paralvinella palmiformis TaxID=53620 RepID=A0AAD9J9C3_9ANNE|nr:hypothetical protein LSH36_501g01130 [Paralvinella palmiformis]
MNRSRNDSFQFNTELKIAVVCSSNQNRSMEAHNFLSKKGFRVNSFGSGNQVKLPGPAPDKPNIYDFNTTYEEMYRDLVLKDKNLYTQNGILHMLDRNRRIKPRPERFQGCKEHFEVIITCEERVYDQVLEGVKRQQCPFHAGLQCLPSRYIQVRQGYDKIVLGHVPRQAAKLSPGV